MTMVSRCGETVFIQVGRFGAAAWRVPKRRLLVAGAFGFCALQAQGRVRRSCFFSRVKGLRALKSGGSCSASILSSTSVLYCTRTRRELVLPSTASPSIAFYLH